MLLRINKKGLRPSAGRSQEQGVRLHIILCPLEEQKWVRTIRERQAKSARRSVPLSTEGVREAVRQARLAASRRSADLG